MFKLWLLFELQSCCREADFTVDSILHKPNSGMWKSYFSQINFSLLSRFFMPIVHGAASQQRTFTKLSVFLSSLWAAGEILHLRIFY